ncbi:hypothetical protein IPC102_09590 [Pseudomonas aeruginosa]|uniref:hypothetical protein n=1 Tax=Pseudomonas aeruginosa TaxID=287 RepID=UPI000F5277C4|nr:hypothetical protein [Pseudomonas aeruginosa]RQH70014.1 hypothetical protein IPC102_09590 [Pseudomonas aeruginosa]
MAKQAAIDLIERYIEKTRTSGSPYADYQFASGLIEMAYAIDDMSTADYDRYLAQLKVAEEAGQLRKRAHEIRLAAQHADFQADASDEIAQAKELERQADELDGTAARRAVQEQSRRAFVAELMTSQESASERRQQLVARGLREMEQFFHGSARHG